MQHSEQLNELATALAKAQGEMEGAKKDSSNPFYKSSYADLASVWDAIRAPFAKNNLCIIQTLKPVDQGICVVTTLAHSSGQWITSELVMMPVKNDPQGVGSTISYARRYALAAISGVYQVDDDAEKGQGRSGEAVNRAGQQPSHSIGRVTRVSGNIAKGDL